jgi:hypothetical protein
VLPAWTGLFTTIIRNLVFTGLIYTHLIRFAITAIQAFCRSIGTDIPGAILSTGTEVIIPIATDKYW